MLGVNMKNLKKKIKNLKNKWIQPYNYFKSSFISYLKPEEEYGYIINWSLKKLKYYCSKYYMECVIKGCDNIADLLTDSELSDLTEEIYEVERDCVCNWYYNEDLDEYYVKKPTYAEYINSLYYR